MTLVCARCGRPLTLARGLVIRSRPTGNVYCADWADCTIAVAEREARIVNDSLRAVETVVRR